jgi:Na+/alanine symporter
VKVNGGMLSVNLIINIIDFRKQRENVNNIANGPVFFFVTLQPYFLSLIIFLFSLFCSQLDWHFPGNSSISYIFNQAYIICNMNSRRVIAWFLSGVLTYNLFHSITLTFKLYFIMFLFPSDFSLKPLKHNQ